MRLELYGCPYLNSILSYQSPSGEEFSPGVVLKDVFDGLGILSDGVIGTDILFSKHAMVEGSKQSVFHYLFKLFISAINWIGWTKNRSPLQLEFLLKSLQRISAVSFLTYNKPDVGIEVRYFQIK